MELPHATHKEVVYGWVAALEALARPRRRPAPLLLTGPRQPTGRSAHGSIA